MPTKSPVFMLGADPEVFLEKDGELISGHDIVPGTKEKPCKLDHCSVQADGLALEFNVNPSKTAEEWVENIHASIKDCKRILPKGVKMRAIPVADFKPGYFKTLPAHAKELGCDPDFNSFSGTANVIPQGAQEKPFRTASGHIHIGWTSGKSSSDADHQWDCRMMAMAVHNWFGVARFAWDPDRRRMNLYGVNGAIRYKPYGVEYRAPSNAWLRSPELWPVLFNRIKRTYDNLSSAAIIPYNNPHDVGNYNDFCYYEKTKVIMDYLMATPKISTKEYL